MTDDARVCAQAVLDLRGMLLRLIKHEGMANDDATNKMYQKTTEALFAASRIKEGAPSIADAAGAGEVHIATVYEDNDGTKHVQLDVENFDDLPVGMKLYARYENEL